MFSRAPRRNSGSFLNTALRPTERRRSPELSDFPLHLCEIRKDQGESEMKKRFFALFLTMALLLPAVLLVIWIIRGASLMRAGMIGIFACIACNVINYFVNKEDFIDLKGLGACCIDGAKQAASIAIPTAACGIIINVVTGQTSLATNLSNLISALGTSNLFLALLIAMVGCMILGMALPTVAAYLVGVILFVPCIRPILLAGGMADFTSNLCANMFVF